MPRPTKINVNVKGTPRNILVEDIVEKTITVIDDRPVPPGPRELVFELATIGTGNPEVVIKSNTSGAVVGSTTRTDVGLFTMPLPGIGLGTTLRALAGVTPCTSVSNGSTLSVMSPNSPPNALRIERRNASGALADGGFGDTFYVRVEFV